MPRATATEIVTDAIASDNLWKAWKLLIDRLRSVDTEDEQNLLLNMIDVATFETIWKNIIESTSPSPSSSSSSSSSTMCCYEASQFLLSYRLLSNIFSKHSKGIILITYEIYSRLLIYSLLCAAEKYNLFACRSQTLSRIINALSLGYHSLLLHFICNEIKCVNHLLAIMSGGWALKSLQILLKHSRATNPVSKDEAYYCSVLQSFIQKAELDIEPIVIIEELTLMYPASEIFSIVVMEYFRPNHLRLLIERISLLWGQPLFIAQGNEPMQRHLHFMLEWLLMRMNDPSILTSHSDISNSSKHTPLAVLLTRGVSAQLDSTDRPTRARAARIAKLFSSLLGHELNLNVSEEDTEKKPEEENATATAITSTGSSNDKHKVVLDSVVNKSEEGDDSDNNNDNNSDIDSGSEFSELEAFEIVEDKPVGDGSTVYLRKCLESKIIIL